MPSDSNDEPRSQALLPTSRHPKRGICSTRQTRASPRGWRTLHPGFCVWIEIHTTAVAWNLFHAEATRVIHNGDRSALPRRPTDDCGHRRTSTPTGVIDISRGSSEANTPGRLPPTTPGTPKVVRERAAHEFHAGGEPTPWTTTVERRAPPSGTVSLGSTPSGGSHGGSPSRHASVGPLPRLFVAECPAETGWDTRSTKVPWDKFENLSGKRLGPTAPTQSARLSHPGSTPKTESQCLSRTG